MLYAGFLARTAGAMQCIGDADTSAADRPLRIVLADCVPPETRNRKPFIEFPAGMDSIGQTLRRAGHSIDYTFLPPEELRREMRGSGEPLRTIGFGNPSIPVSQADLLAISMMNYLQTPLLFALLSLSRIPLQRNERTVGDPLIILGGHIWPNPLPLSRFYDVMVIGDGEDAMAAIARCVAENRDSRGNQLAAISKVTGAYVPGHTRKPVPIARIDFADEKYAAGSSIIMDGTAALILSRGCTHSCAFCNSGWVSGPFRIKPYPQIKRQIDLLSRWGAQRIMLCSIAASSYQWGNATISTIMDEITSYGMEVRSMSDRPESFDAANLRRAVHSTGKVRIAVETHPALREKVLLKNLAEDELDRAIGACITAHVEKIQFYAILAIPPISPGIVEHLPDGFAGENDSHIRYLADLACATADRMRREGIQRRENQPLVIIDCMPLIPAIGTRLQCVSFPQWNEYLRRIEQLRSMVGAVLEGFVKVTAGLDELSYLLQAVLERGGPSAGELIRSAWCMTDCDMPTPEMVRTAIKTHGLDYPAFLSEVPPDRLPYAGLITDTVTVTKKEHHGARR